MADIGLIVGWMGKPLARVMGFVQGAFLFPFHSCAVRGYSCKNNILIWGYGMMSM